jgi:hypothetical protein
MEAARHWATIYTSARGGDDEAAEDMRRSGSSEDEIRAALGDDEDTTFGVWQDNAETVAIFMSLQTQWRVGPMGGYLGFDYPGMQAALTMRGVKTKSRRQTFEDLQAMERAALRVLNKKP